MISLIAWENPTMEVRSQNVRTRLVNWEKRAEVVLQVFRESSVS